MSGHNDQMHCCWPVDVHHEFFQPVLLCPSAAPPAVNTRRSSNFCLVGSHKITLASLGHSKFPLDKVMICHGVVGKLFSNCFCYLWKLKPSTRLFYSDQSIVSWWEMFWTLFSWFFFLKSKKAKLTKEREIEKDKICTTQSMWNVSLIVPTELYFQEAFSFCWSNS